MKFLGYYFENGKLERTAWDLNIGPIRIVHWPWDKQWALQFKDKHLLGTAKVTYPKWAKK